MKDFIDQTDNAMVAIGIMLLPVVPAVILALAVEHFTGFPFQVGTAVFFFAGISIYSYLTRKKKEN